MLLAMNGVPIIGTQKKVASVSQDLTILKEMIAGMQTTYATREYVDQELSLKVSVTDFNEFSEDLSDQLEDIVNDAKITPNHAVATFKVGLAGMNVFSALNVVSNLNSTNVSNQKCMLLSMNDLENNTTFSYTNGSTYTLDCTQLRVSMLRCGLTTDKIIYAAVRNVHGNYLDSNIKWEYRHVTRDDVYDNTVLFFGLTADYSLVVKYNGNVQNGLTKATSFTATNVAGSYSRVNNIQIFYDDSNCIIIRDIGMNWVYEVRSTGAGVKDVYYAEGIDLDGNAIYTDDVMMSSISRVVGGNNIQGPFFSIANWKRKSDDQSVAASNVRDFLLNLGAVPINISAGNAYAADMVRAKLLCEIFYK